MTGIELIITGFIMVMTGFALIITVLYMTKLVFNSIEFVISINDYS